MPSFKKIPSPSNTKFCHEKLVFAAAYGKNFVTTCIVLIEQESVTDRQTRHLDDS